MQNLVQISAALLGEDQKLKLPRFLEDEEKDPEATKQVPPLLPLVMPSVHIRLPTGHTSDAAYVYAS